MTMKAYVYERVDVCDPQSGSYHPEGGLLVITAGAPEDAVDAGVGNVETAIVAGAEHQVHRLPEPDRVMVLSDDEAEAVFAFPDAGCC